MGGGLYVVIYYRMNELGDAMAVLSEQHTMLLQANAGDDVVPRTPSSDAADGDGGKGNVGDGKGKDKGKKGKGKGKGGHGGWMPRCVKLAKGYLRQDWESCDAMIEDFKSYEGFQAALNGRS